MPTENVNPEFTTWSRVVLGLSSLMIILTGVFIYSTRRYIDTEEPNFGTRAGLWTLMILSGMVTGCLFILALNTQKPMIQQGFGVFSIIIGFFLLVTASLYVRRDSEDTDSVALFAGLAFSIALTMCGAGVASFRLSRIEAFDAEG